MAFFVVTDNILSVDGKKTIVKDKKCGTPLTSDRELKSGTECESYTTNPVETQCNNASKPKYKVVEADGCTVDTNEWSHTDNHIDFTYYYYLCTEITNAVTVYHGTVKCKYNQTTSKCETDHTTWSITNKKYKSCSFEMTTL